jgi:hypothetical protein
MEAGMLFSGTTDHSGPRVAMTEETKTYLRLLIVGAIGSSVALEIMAPNLPVYTAFAISGVVGLLLAAIARGMRVV